ncbi:hypothetical protein AAEU32_15795 [Pseudoalteromonas sp. SSDWG2]|uniref:hypothetical protein n=1 Tax=Pseudoalteromonas sp. SSDWG2 TaxID=3139391 RepID=UPI003BABD335
MKSYIAKKSPDALLRDYPIQGKVDGWFFRCREESPCQFVAVGEDLWGRKVCSDNIDYDAALTDCINQANEILNREQGS